MIKTTEKFCLHIEKDREGYENTLVTWWLISDFHHNGSWTKNQNYGTSLVAQWLRICLPKKGTQVWALVQEDPTEQLSPHATTTDPVPLEPVLRSQRSTTVRSPRTKTKSSPRAQQQRPNSAKKKKKKKNQNYDQWDPVLIFKSLTEILPQFFFF